MPHEPLVRALHALTPVLWTAAAAAYLVVFTRDDAGAARWAVRLALLALAGHLAELAATWAAGIPPLVQPGAHVSGTGLATALVYLVLERRVGRRTIGVFAVGTAAVLATAGAAFGDPLALSRPDLPTLQTSVHVAAAILGSAALFLAAMFGALLLAQQRALRGRSFGLFWERLPSVELLDSFTRGSLGAAAFFLTAMIGLGHVARHAADRVGPYFHDAKIVYADALWALCVAVFVARKLHRLRPRTMAFASIVLFLCALASPAVDRWSESHRGF
jgi:ABC-type uncharacterized transport system permease subunit